MHPLLTSSFSVGFFTSFVSRGGPYIPDGNAGKSTVAATMFSLATADVDCIPVAFSVAEIATSAALGGLSCRARPPCTWSFSSLNFIKCRALLLDMSIDKSISFSRYTPFSSQPCKRSRQIGEPQGLPVAKWHTTGYIVSFHMRTRISSFSCITCFLCPPFQYVAIRYCLYTKSCRYLHNMTVYYPIPILLATLTVIAALILNRCHNICSFSVSINKFVVRHQIVLEFTSRSHVIFSCLLKLFRESIE